MKTKLGMALIGAALCFAGIGPASATEATTTFESCVDGRGQTIVAEADASLPELVRIISGAGKVTLRYNPDLLPRLSQSARIFLYMDQCARHGIGDTGPEMTVARAQLADCMAVNAMLAGNAIKREDLPAMQAELVFSDSEWAQLPGPARKFDLQNCSAKTSGNVLRLPLDTPPSGKQTSWNNCVRACADRLWTCQKGCRGTTCDTCLEAHRQCKEACGPADKPAAEKPTAEKAAD